MTISVYSDGSCENDGSGKTPMGIGYVISIDGDKVLEVAAPKGFGTSPRSEWIAFGESVNDVLFTVIKELSSRGVIIRDAVIHFYSDNEMLVRQVNEEYKHSKFMYEWCKYFPKFIKLRSLVNKCTVSWVNRNLNVEADRLSKLGRYGHSIRDLRL